MSRFWIATIAAPILQLALTGAAYADAAAEKYVDDALPFMYHSCASAVEEASGDNAYLDKVLQSLIAVSLYNRDVTTTMFDISDAAKTTMRDKFVEALKTGCAADKNALLAGVVDHAVTEALAGSK